MLRLIASAVNHRRSYVLLLSLACIAAIAGCDEQATEARATNPPTYEDDTSLPVEDSREVAALNRVGNEREDFELTVSGVLAKKLEPGTRLAIWNPTPSIKGARFLLENLPATLAFEQFNGHVWFVDFFEPREHRRIFSVCLSRDLFDKPRAINLRLDPPTPRIRPVFSRVYGDFHYAAGITKRIGYYYLPCWDNELRRLVPPRPPVMNITRQADGVTIQESEMEIGCWASHWWTSIDDSTDLTDQADYLLVVRYDSGGLFDTIETKLKFRFDQNRHRLKNGRIKR